jgi:predicted NUDIX family NTP pyrophosphohydrolase
MAKTSAGLLVYRRVNDTLEVLLVHPGGPFWAKRDRGAWSIPKGEFGPQEDPLRAARREFREETGCDVAGEFVPLTPVRQAGGKVVHTWAVEGDCDASRLRSNRFSMEWPPGSGVSREFPEVDRAAWFPIQKARERILPSQNDLLTQLLTLLRDRA